MGARPKSGRSQADLYRYSGAGLHFAATIGVFAWLGWWLDRKWECSPWLFLVGVFLGFGLGLYSMIRRFTPPAPPRR